MVTALINSQAEIVRSSYYLMEPSHFTFKDSDIENKEREGLRYYAEMYRASVLDNMSTIANAVTNISDPLYFHFENNESPEPLLMRILGLVKRILVKISHLPQEHRERKYQSKIKVFKDQFKGERCFIIGNGPSLKMDDLDKLANEYSFATNKVYYAFNSTVWRPTFYAVQDALVLEQTLDTVKSLDVRYKFLRADSLSKFEKIPDNTFFFRKKTRLYNGKPASFSEDPSKCVYEGSTVTFLCLQLALYMGFKEIYLLGMDFNYSIYKDKSGIHFENTADYFSSKYKSNGEVYYYARLDYATEAFELADKVAKSHGSRIFNATRGGKLEVFERVEFDTLFDKSGGTL